MAASAPRSGAPRLDDALAGLLARAGGRTVRVVDGRTGTVVGVAGAAAPGSDDPAEVAALLREALPPGAAGADDVTLVTDRGVHVLRPGPVAGVFVHLQLDPGADPAHARSALADPAVSDVVRRAVDAVPPVRSGPSESDPPPRQPALAVLSPDRVRTGDAARAVAALAALGRPAAAPPVLPRRRSGSAVWSIPAARDAGCTAGLPERVWSGDPETLRRLADGLRGLS